MTKVMVFSRQILFSLALVFSCVGPGFCSILTDTIPDFGVESSDISKALILSGEHELLNTPSGVKTSDSLLIKAIEVLNKGGYDTTIAMMNRYLVRFPGSADAYEVLGMSLAKKGKLDEGLAALRKAREINPHQCSALTKIGDILLAKKEYSEAKKSFQAAVECFPEDRLAHQRLGLLCEKEKDFKGAIEHYERGILGTDPGYVGIKVNLANLYNSFGKYEKTLHLLQGCVATDSKNLYAHLMLGVAYLGVQKYSDAIREISVVRHDDPKDARAALSLGVCYRATGDMENAEKNIADAVALEPNSPLPYFQMAETYSAAQRYDKAMEFYANVEKLNQPVVAKKGIAGVYMKQKNVSKAISVYQELINSGKADMQTYDLLITAYQVNGQLDKAEETAKQLCERFPKSDFPYYRLGIYYSFRTQYKEALVQLEKALALAPTAAPVLKALSLTCLRLEQKERAISYARQIVKNDPDDIDAAFFLAGLLQDAGDRGALQAYKDVLSKKPDHVFALNNLALLLAESGAPADALQYVEKAAKLDQGNGNVLDTYGWVLYRNKDVKKALPVLQRAQALLPKNPTILYHVAKVLYESGKKAEAKKVLEQLFALKIDFKNKADAEALFKSL